MPWFTVTDTIILWSAPTASVQIFSHFKAAYCSIWQVLICIPLQVKKLIFRPHLSVFIQNYHEHVISFFSFCCCCTTTKDSKVPPGKSAGRITPHTFQAPRIWDWSEVFNRLSSDPMSSSFYHCQNQLSAFILKSLKKKKKKKDVWWKALSFWPR